MSSARFVQRAMRVSAFGGVMAARVEAAREDQGQPTPIPQASRASDGRREIELSQFQAEFPGLVSISRVVPDEPWEEE